MAKRKNKEELTTKMHSEFTVTDEMDRKHITWSVLDMIDQKVLTKAEAMEIYGITQKDLDNYQDEWKALQ